jgi:hypothetical protein
MRWIAWSSVAALITGYTLLVVLISPKKAKMDRAICVIILAVNVWMLSALAVWLRP